MDYKELRNPSQPADTPDGFVSEIRSIIDLLTMRAEVYYDDLGKDYRDEPIPQI